jgi:hypothetical protein
VSIKTKLAGVTMKNDDGSSRQAFLKTCSSGDPLVLKREPKNKYDRNAIAVFRGTDQLGYLSKEVAEELAKVMDSGKKLTAEILEITGGEKGKPTLGCNIQIFGATWDYDDEDEDEEFEDEDDDDLDEEEDDEKPRRRTGNRAAKADSGFGMGCMVAIGLLIAVLVYFLS